MVLLILLNVSSFQFANRLQTRIMSTAKRSMPSCGESSSDKKKIKLEGAQDAPMLPFTPTGFNAARARLMTKPTETFSTSGKCVVYWMFRDQRVNDNNAIHYAQAVARDAGVPFKVVFNLLPKFLNATIRQYGFMIKGLEEVERELRNHDIPMHLLMGDPVVNIPAFVREHEAMLLVTDFSPLRTGVSWINSIAAALDNQVTNSSASSSAASAKSKFSSSNSAGQIPLVQVDAHNVVPCWVASPKLEYGARTIRSKISALLPQFLTDIAPLQKNPSGSLDCDPIDWKAALASLQIDRTVKEVNWLVPGARGAQQMLQSFIGKVVFFFSLS